MKNDLTEIERNILVGSILGDGSLALYGRSKNAYYREHGCERQNPYRQWKGNKLSELEIKFNMNTKYGSLRSPTIKSLLNFITYFI